jgi:methylated-DNA-[protein]-cysteine S-methyltransferase
MKALEIPPGEVRPYSWIAGRSAAGRRARRRVGAGEEPGAAADPCHRVVRSDGHIGNYSLGGPRNKRSAAGGRGREAELLERLAASGVRYLGNAEARHFCYRPAAGSSTLVETNRVRFHSEREAIAAGFHPCGDCRPPVALAS